MKKNILVITGSPRKHGNTDIMADAFICGAEKAGHTVNKYETAFKRLTGCRACDTCWRKGENSPCSFGGSFNEELAPLLENADVIVLCTPLYFYGMASSLQMALEKIYAYLRQDAPKKIKITEAVLLLCGGEDGDEKYQGVINTYLSICDGMQWKDSGMVIAEGIYEKGKIVNTNYLIQAEKLGESI